MSLQKLQKEVFYNGTELPEIWPLVKCASY